MAIRRFGTFEGVFTPCLLSILGVIMYLRLGWVVGSAGLFGAVAIILLANAITLVTTLSMSSVLTNIRIGAGGAYSIISKSLGLEAGGAIGLPLYISQAISTAFYVVGFAECWLFVFPHHSVLLVALIAWIILVLISFYSAKLAFQIQFAIMALIALSLVSIFWTFDVSHPVVMEWSRFPFENFWGIFAIFFPAVTGVLTGASMSGELTDPRRSIPKGTLLAVGISFVIYLGLTFWFASKAPSEDLVARGTLIVDLSRWHWLVIGGIMGATLSSAIGMLVSSPRILLAMGKHSVFPFASVFSRVNKKGEPTTAILFTALVSLITILFGTLDQIAQLLTMFFLITYGILNLTVFIEQTIGIVSFRPTFRLPRSVSFLGGAGCFAVMFLVNLKFSLMALLVIVGIYFLLLRRGAKVYSPNIRSGMLVFLAEKMAKAASQLPYYPKIWKPNLIMTMEHNEAYERVLPLIEAIVLPAGRVLFFKITNADELSLVSVPAPREGKEPLRPIDVLSEEFKAPLMVLREKDIFVESSIVEADSYLKGSVAVLQTVKGMFFPPNTMFVALGAEAKDDAAVQGVISRASQEGLGIIVAHHHPKVGLSQQQVVNLWIRQQSPNLNLSILITLQLEKNWGTDVRIIQMVEADHQVEDARQYLLRLKDLMRLPTEVQIEIVVGNDIRKALGEAPAADINIFGMQESPNIDIVRQFADHVQTTVLFLKDSKYESAMA